MAHRAFSDIVSDKALRNLMTWELFAESKVSSAITKVAIAAAMDGFESRADVVFGDNGNGVRRGRIGSRK